MINWTTFYNALYSLVRSTPQNELEFSKSLTSIINNNILLTATDIFGNKLIPSPTSVIQNTIYIGLMQSRTNGKPDSFIESITTGLKLFMTTAQIQFINAPPSGIGVINIITFPGSTIKYNIVNVNNIDIFCSHVIFILKSFFTQIQGNITYNVSGVGAMNQNWNSLN